MSETPQIPETPRIPQPVRFLDTTPAEASAIGALGQTLTYTLRGLPAVVRSHTHVDRIDLELEDGTLLRVQLQALR